MNCPDCNSEEVRETTRTYNFSPTKIVIVVWVCKSCKFRWIDFGRKKDVVVRVR